jgi:predicted acylesterase/phospholipase RssA
VQPAAGAVADTIHAARATQHFERGRLTMKFPTLCLVAGIGISGCVTLPRGDHPPPDSPPVAPVGFSPSVRALGIDWRHERPPEEILKGLRAAASDGSLDILALSGGGASGAFGAGTLVGLSRGRARPRFELVTGVSTGALIAPFAFLGQAWDPELTHAFAGGPSQGLMQRRGLEMLFGASFYEGEPLKRLVEGFVDDRMIQEVVRETAKGRLLLIATTDLDRSETVVWNLGLVAAAGGERARTLFRDILVASASVPGVFPPVMISVGDAAGAVYEEMHVDGGATVPFFIAPEAVLVAPGKPLDAGGGNIFVVVNSELNVVTRTTPVNTLSIVERAFSSALSHASRTALAQNAAYAQKLGMSFRYTAIPSNDGFAGFLDFEPEKMRAVFDYASSCAARGQIWLSKVEQTLNQAANPIAPAGPVAPHCPVDSADIAKGAMRR